MLALKDVQHDWKRYLAWDHMKTIEEFEKGVELN